MTSLFTVFLAAAALADPCGMVPPIALPGEPIFEIERSGLQQTYAFYRDGLETVVLRPGFTGSVDAFGMLIPFPAAPALRKIDDKTFEHLAAALDPPVVEVEFYEPRPEVEAEPAPEPRATAAARPSPSPAPSPLRRDEVRVLNEEAVGMYEVAVLAAGSPAALRKWMEKHAFRYPDGMEDTLEDYVQAQWVFVAIKVSVGGATATHARPGMRDANTALPSGSRFGGFVQGMGFRFPTDEPVIPMRLSTFNGDDTHNRVYFLSDEPVRMEGVGRALVQRQLAGADLYENLVGELEVVVRNGRLSEIDEKWWARLDRMRSPVPYNAVARDLIASDLLAVTTGEPSLAFEEREKDLLRISESLGLRGEAMDAMHTRAIMAERKDALEGALGDVRDMTLTVIDGDFPRDYIRDNNLVFRAWTMPANENFASMWHNRPQGPKIQIPR